MVKRAKKYSPFWFASPEIIGVKVGNRGTDRQTNSLTPYTWVCRFFLSVKFATSLLTSLTSSLLEQQYRWICTDSDKT